MGEYAGQKCGEAPGVAPTAGGSAIIGGISFFVRVEVHENGLILKMIECCGF